ncbi:spermidine/putrescine transport system permease protein [Methylomagnum ishizawai]|uniref:Spermidine/putrescine transport system permease protein n=1 Tax=Methylomagnum ishizawai TaxID=1760988 RepID=A0A1Y6D0V9_9GAMM|nr:spermidine/putrescine ABC transporter permease PotB [Methylomagnum ishizawai]SMF93615.1 spermidine/putrescine transport system permease protein [Methylomagnum ishizawai]
MRTQPPIFAYLLPLWLILFTLLPLLMVVAVSLMRRDESGLIAPVFTLANYARLLNPLYLKVFGHSLALAAVATTLCLIVGYPFAYLLSRVRAGWRPVLLTWVIVPFWTNSLARVYAMRGMLAAQGPVNTGLLALGWIDEPIRLLYTGPAVAIGLVYVLLPFMVLPLYSSFEKLDRRLIEAARDLGAGRFATFWRVIVPLTAPGIAAGSLLVFLPALGMFYVTDVLGGARGLLVGNFLKDQFLDARDWPFGAAASVLVIALLFVFLALYGRVRRGIGHG